MSLDIWTAVYLFIGVGVAAMGFVETLKTVLRAFQSSLPAKKRPAAREAALYSVLALVLCVGLTWLVGRPLGIPWEITILVGGGANACAAIVFRWFLSSLLPRALAGLTKSARDRIDDLATADQE